EGWNVVDNKEEYIARTIALLKESSKYNLAINLQASGLIAVDVDDIEKFSKLYRTSFDTLACKTPRGYHYYFVNDINLNKNITLEQFGVELHANHLSNIYGEGYEFFMREPKKASEFTSFFNTILELYDTLHSKKQEFHLSGSNLYTQVYNKDLSICIHKSIKGEKKEKKDIIDLCIHDTLGVFDRFRELEKNEEFIKFVFEVCFGVLAKRSMLCVLHEEQHPSASVFRSCVSGRYLYKDFHTNRAYSLLDLLIEYYSIPEHLQKLFRLCFAKYLLKIFSLKEETKELYKLLRTRDNNLAKAYFLVASLNTNELTEHFLGVRDLARMLKLKNITRANRVLNYLCLIDVIDKKACGRGKAYSYEVKEVNREGLDKLANELERTKKIDIYKLSKTLALKYFAREKVEKIYMRGYVSVEIVKKIFT
ncbi:MAG: hypothetical protein ACP5KK_03315, partial [Candidatus Nanoarchaeia archaeon]